LQRVVDWFKKFGPVISVFARKGNFLAAAL
jgi:hypothetical protein